MVGAGSGGSDTGGGGASAGTGGEATRSLLGCGESASGYPCGPDQYLWKCPDEAQPVGPYTGLGPTNYPDVGCESAGDESEWCCDAAVILDTRLVPADVCPPNQQPFQFNDRPDGEYVCVGVI
jgi:hypothetical protein